MCPLMLVKWKAMRGKRRAIYPWACQNPCCLSFGQIRAGNLIRHSARRRRDGAVSVIYRCALCGKHTTQSSPLIKRLRGLATLRKVHPKGKRLYRISDMTDCLARVARGMTIKAVALSLSSRTVEKLSHAEGGRIYLRGIMPPGLRPGWTLERWKRTSEAVRKDNLGRLKIETARKTDWPKYRLWIKRIRRWVLRAVQHPDNCYELLSNYRRLSRTRIQRNLIRRYGNLKPWPSE